MSKNIPTKINNYNVYNAGDKLLGVGDELTLPDFEATSETVSGAGILGEIDDPTIGYFGNMQLEIPFRTLDKEATNMMDQSGTADDPGRRPGDRQLRQHRAQVHPRGGQRAGRKADRRQTETGQHYGQRCDPEHPLHLD